MALVELASRRMEPALVDMLKTAPELTAALRQVLAEMEQMQMELAEVDSQEIPLVLMELARTELLQVVPAHQALVHLLQVMGITATELAAQTISTPVQTDNKPAHPTELPAIHSPILKAALTPTAHKATKVTPAVELHLAQRLMAIRRSDASASSNNAAHTHRATQAIPMEAIRRAEHHRAENLRQRKIRSRSATNRRAWLQLVDKAGEYRIEPRVRILSLDRCCSKSMEVH
jgi:hypothetical protein